MGCHGCLPTHWQGDTHLFSEDHGEVEVDKGGEEGQGIVLVAGVRGQGVARQTQGLETGQRPQAADLDRQRGSCWDTPHTAQGGQPAPLREAGWLSHLLQVIQSVAGQGERLQAGEGREPCDLCQAVVGQAEIPEANQSLQPSSHLLNVVEGQVCSREECAAQCGYTCIITTRSSVQLNVDTHVS